MATNTDSDTDTTKYSDAEYWSELQDKQDAEVARFVRMMNKDQRIVLATIAGGIQEASQYWLEHF